jgi:hypothetical protein
MQRINESAEHSKTDKGIQRAHLDDWQRSESEEESLLPCSMTLKDVAVIQSWDGWQQPQ